MSLEKSSIPDMNLMLEDIPVEMTRSHYFNRNGYEPSLHLDYELMVNLRHMDLVRYAATQTELNRTNIPDELP